MGSPLYAELLEVALADLEAGGPVSDVVDRWDRNPMDDAVPLRLMGNVHRIVLDGRAAALAAHYPTAGGRPSFPDCAEAFLATVSAHRGEIRTGMVSPPQTNEVGRAGVVLGGMMEVMRIAGRPIRLLEIGASAGVNLRLDGYRYAFGAGDWGDPASPVLVETDWRGSLPDLTTDVLIAERRGCDTAPIDVRDPASTRRLLSYVWADQVSRFDRTAAAAAVVGTLPMIVDESAASAWLERRLAAAHRGVITVVMHSAVVQYLERRERSAVDAVIRAAAGRATREAPLARLSFEPGRRNFALRLEVHPAGLSLTLADAHPHGAWAEWFIGSDPP